MLKAKRRRAKKKKNTARSRERTAERVPEWGTERDLRDIARNRPDLVPDIFRIRIRVYIHAGDVRARTHSQRRRKVYLVPI